VRLASGMQVRRSAGPSQDQRVGAKAASCAPLMISTAVRMNETLVWEAAANSATSFSGMEPAGYAPTGQCCTITSAIGKSLGLPVQRAAPCWCVTAAIKQSA
jgi:hypothetical protein